MQLTVLGSGSIHSNLNRNPSGYLLKAGKNLVLMDCGPGIRIQLLKLKIDLRKINLILLSHFHVDHFNDLIALLFSFQVPAWENQKVRKPLTIIGPSGTKKQLALIKKLMHLTKFDFPLKVKELHNSSMNFNGLKIVAKPMKHLGNANGYRFSFKNKVLTYSGDTTYCNEIISLAKNADLLILECASIKEHKLHLNPIQCGEIAFKSSPKKLLLTHFYPVIEKFNIKKLVEKIFKGKTFVAKDLMKFRF